MIFKKQLPIHMSHQTSGHSPEQHTFPYEPTHGSGLKLAISVMWKQQILMSPLSASQAVLLC